MAANSTWPRPDLANHVAAIEIETVTVADGKASLG